jgi:hypothetical protein
MTFEVTLASGRIVNAPTMERAWKLSMSTPTPVGVKAVK